MLNKLVIDVAIYVLQLLSRIPLPISRKVGKYLGCLAYLMMKKRRNVGLVNLKLCFPEKTVAEREDILRQHFADLFTIGLSYGLLFGASKTRMESLITYRGMEHLQTYYKNRPVVLLAPHFLALDLGGNRSTIDISGYTMFSQQRNKYLSQRVKEARTRFMKLNGGEIFSRQDGLRSIVKKMKLNKLPFYYLPDQDMDERSSIYVPFFAHEFCATLDTLPKILKLADAVVIPMATYLESDGYVVEFGEAWDNYPTGNLYDDIAHMNRKIEEMIIKHPSQYLWMHKRFKTQPDLPRGKLYENC